MSNGIMQFHNGVPVNGSTLQAASGVILSDGRTVENAIDFIESNSHNAVYRGKNITANFDSGKFSAAIADGSFDDIYLGDYIEKSVTIGGTKYTDRAYVAHIDPYYGGYNNNAVVNTHHVELVHVIMDLTYNMNSTNTTAGGYVGSEMFTYLKNTVLPALQAAFGSSHFISHQKLYSNAVTTTAWNRLGTASGASTGWAWSTDQFISLMTEAQVYGATCFSSSGFDTGEAFQQLALFALKHPNEIFGNRYPWLRDVASDSHFCICHNSGFAHHNKASYVNHVAPITLCK